MFLLVFHSVRIMNYFSHSFLVFSEVLFLCGFEIDFRDARIAIYNNTCLGLGFGYRRTANGFLYCPDVSFHVGDASVLVCF